MSGIYIPNMEMPTDKELHIRIDEKGEVYVYGTYPTKLFKAVPVPPHGDLVCRNEMFVEFVIEGQKSTRYKVGEKWELNGEEIRRVIQRLPAVIPADKEGE